MMQIVKAKLQEPQIGEIDFNLEDEGVPIKNTAPNSLTFGLLTFALRHPATAIKSLFILNKAFKLDEERFREAFGSQD